MVFGAFYKPTPTGTVCDIKLFAAGKICD